VNPIGEILNTREIVVCAGSGGVGKTTTSAAIALRAAIDGKKAAVLTIDPAKRLASSLGLKELSNEPHKVSARKFTSAGIEPKGELWAMMLDTKSTFDSIVERYASTEEQKEKILGNRFYRNISGTLSGTQEYMAMEKLYELYADGDYDLIVIDTPPTRNALDFLDAPKRMTDFLDSKVLKWFLIPYMKAGGGLFKVANVAASTFLRLVKKIVGAEVLDDTAEFFANLEGMYDGFKQRAREVAHLLQSDATTFIVSRLNESGLHFGALVVNRVHPRWGDEIDVRPRQLSRLEQGDRDAQLLAKLIENERSFRKVTTLEDHNLDALARKVPRHRWVRVPYLEQEAVDLTGLVLIGDQLIAG
jgi:anion-transporting  ArsA/GET3 family ATPase